MTKVFIGTSGWVYEDWWGEFYPRNIKPEQRLEYYAKSFVTVELNASFYHLPHRNTFENWNKKTPDRFVFSTKLSKYITQNLKLNNAEEPLELFLHEAAGLEKKLSVVLVQLPPNLHANKERLEDFLEICAEVGDQRFSSSPNPREIKVSSLPKQKDSLVPMETQKSGCLPAQRPRFAFEFRHESWLDKEIYDLLRKYKAGFVMQDSAGRWPAAEVVTSEFVYLRFHGPGLLYSSNYPDKILKEWAEKINSWLGEGLDVYAYFNNDVNAYAIQNALKLKELTNR
ncbi:MAG TPA: DUF72 domain-containing protein [Candidatus Nanoarchaeia archaeon]